MIDLKNWDKPVPEEQIPEGERWRGASSAPPQEFSAAKTSAVTGDANTRLTVGEEADAKPLIKRRG
jgi:hypothetical protein